MRVTVHGAAKSGKSTVAILIESALKKAGIDVVMHDEELHPSFFLPDAQNDRLAVLADRGTIIHLWTEHSARPVRREGDA